MTENTIPGCQTKSGPDESMLVKAMSRFCSMYLTLNLAEGTYQAGKISPLLEKAITPEGRIDKLVQKVSRQVHRDMRSAFSSTFSLRAMVKAFESGENCLQMDLHLCGTDQVWHWSRLGVTLIDDTEKKYAVALVLPVDGEAKNREELRTVAEDARRANEAKTDFLSRISHEMRMPMNVILGAAALARDEVDKPREVCGYLEQISTSCHFMAGILNDMLDVSRIENGQMALNPMPYNLNDFIAQLNLMITPRCRAKNITFSVHCECPQERFILVDKVRFTQIFLNLLTNMVLYTCEGGHMTMTITRLSRSGSVIYDRFLLHSDRIIKDIDDHPFEPFHLVEDADESIGWETGLGMTMADKLVHLMGGSIRVNRLVEGSSEFLVELPLPACHPSLRTEMEKELSVGDRSGRIVLVCEDHPINMQIACRMLYKQGYKVLKAENGREGAAIFLASAPGEIAAILMDIRMPVMDGIDATAIIRAMNRKDAKTVPIIAMTANAYDSDKEKSLAAGMNAYLVKPIAPQQLYTALEDEITRADNAY